METREALPHPFFPDPRSITLTHHLGFSVLSILVPGTKMMPTLLPYALISLLLLVLSALIVHLPDLETLFYYVLEPPDLTRFKKKNCFELDLMLHLQALLSPCLAFYVKR